MSSNELHVGDVGIPLTLTITEDSVAVDVSAATTTITFTQPDDTVVTKTGVFVTDGTDGQVKYVVEADFLSLSGWWRMQAFVDWGDTEYYSDIAEFRVYPNTEPWQHSLRTLLRSLIGDDVVPYTYSDGQLDQLLVNSAVLVDMEVDFVYDYTINIAGISISPDPVSNSDRGFINLVCLKAAWMVKNKDAEAAAKKAVLVKDASSQIDYREAAIRVKSIAERMRSEYERMKTAWKTGNGMSGQGIVGPFNSGHVDSDQARR